MDAYSGYNQIHKDLLDAPKTTFMSNHDNYYYNVTPFSLKNIDTTYQWLMDVIFSHKIRRNLEVYVYNMIVKTGEEHSHVDDLEDILQSVRRYDMHLNPSKYSFGVQAGKYIGFMPTRRGIEGNKYKCQRVIDNRTYIYNQETTYSLLDFSKKMPFLRVR